MIKRCALLILAMTLAFLLPAMPVQADFTDYTFENTIITDQGEFDMILSFDSDSEQATLQINGLEVEDPHRPGVATLLPDFTIVGDYLFDPTAENLTFDICWTGDQEVPDFPQLTITSMCAATVDDGLKYDGRYNFFSGDLHLTIGKKYITPIGSVTEEATYTYRTLLQAPPLPSSNPQVAFAYLDSNQWEHSEGYPALFDAPYFSENDGLGLFVNDPNRTFGYWQTRKILNAPAAGRYALRIYLTPSNPSGTGRSPELRVRVFSADNSQSQMAVFAQTTPTTQVPEYIEVVWYSDGVTPWRVAIDLLSFVPDYSGGYVITEVTNTPLTKAFLYLNPPEVTIAQGEIATFDLYINSEIPVGGYTTLILYNPVDIQIEQLLQGRDPYLGYPLVAQVNDSQGTIALSSIQGTALDKPTGTIHLLTLNFKALEKGTHYIELTESEVASTSAQLISLEGQFGATINVENPIETTRQP